MLPTAALLWALAATGGEGLNSGASEARTIALAGPPDLSCPALSELEAALAKRFQGTRVRIGAVQPGDLGLQLALGPHGRLHLWLWVEPDQKTAQRDLPPGAANCSELAVAISLITEDWLRMLPVPESAAPPKAALAFSAPVLEVPIVENPRPVIHRNAEPDGGALAHVDRGPGLALRADVRAAILGAVDGAGNAPGVGATVALELGVGPMLGAGLGLDLLTDASAQDPVVSSAQLVVHRQAGELYLVVHPLPQWLPGGALLAGAQLQRLDAVGEGYPQTSEREVYALAPWVSARYQLGLSRSWSLFAQAALALGLNQQVFTAVTAAQQQYTVMTLSNLNWTLALGVGWGN